MSFDAKVLLEVLRGFFIVLGGISIIWGIYDLFGDSGQQNSVGGKKIIGGIVFVAVSSLLMTWAINDIGTAMSQAGVGILLPNISTYISGLLRW